MRKILVAIAFVFCMGVLSGCCHPKGEVKPVTKELKKEVKKEVKKDCCKCCEEKKK